MQATPKIVRVAATLICCTSAAAHVPILSDGSARGPQTAIELENVQISRVVYHEITAAAPRLWLSFTVAEPQRVALRFAVPKIDRLADYRPNLVLLGPGLEPVSLPFEAPADLGGVIYETSDIESPEVFFEPFSGTDAWELIDGTLDLPAAGQYYLVGYHPDAQPGKVWVALGILESFTPEEIAALPETVAAVRDFHEVGPEAAPPCFLIPLGLTTAALFGWRTARRRLTAGHQRLA